MRGALRRLLGWWEERTGLVSASSQFLQKPMPASVGWLHTLGAVLGALFTAQMASGVLLAFHYSASPDSAYASLRWLVEEIPLGGTLHALHAWGASFIAAALALHMLRVFSAGAWRAPREINWLSGVALLLVFAGFAATGQALPWDQKGYWATQIGMGLVESVPFAGETLKLLLLGGEGNGAPALSRFYIIHVFVLPMAFFAVLGFHLYMLRRHGPKPAASAASGRPFPFFPAQGRRDMTMAGAVLLALLATAWMFHPHDSGPADPSGAAFTPRPEWYFYSHFMLMRLMGGLPRVLSAVFAPALLIALLAALPWLGRMADPDGPPTRKTLAAGYGLFALVAGLTLAGFLVPKGGGAPEAVPAVAMEGLSPAEAGRRVWEAHRCAKCHKIHGAGKDYGPDLSRVGARLRPEYLRDWIRNPQSFDPFVDMPPFKGDEKELAAVAVYLETLR